MTTTKKHMHEYVDIWIESKNWESVFTKRTKDEVTAELHAVAEATYEMAIDDFTRHIKETFLATETDNQTEV